MYIGVKHCVAWTEEFTFMYQINLMLAVFNLIPGLPLDGGRIFRAWLAQYRDYSQATMIAASFSKIIALLLLISVAYTYIRFTTINLTFVIAAIFLYVSAKTEVKVAGFRQMKVLAQKKAELTTKGIMPTKHLTAVSGIRARDVINQFGPEYYYIVIVVDNDFRLRGTLTETEVWEGLPSHGIYATMDKFLS
jgi:Zn-dependent proteases